MKIVENKYWQAKVMLTGLFTGMQKHYYLPLTMGRIENNPNLAPENPGY